MDEKEHELEEPVTESDQEPAADADSELEAELFEAKPGFRAPPIILFLLVAVIGFTVIFIFMSWQRSRHPVLNKQAKQSLHALGSTQLAYQAMNDQYAFGTFDAFKGSKLVEESDTQSNMIDQYSLYWEVNNVDLELDPEGDTDYNSFTIIAYPTVARVKGQQLLTFAVTEDQRIRVYTPQNGSKPGEISSWDPIL